MFTTLRQCTECMLQPAWFKVKTLYNYNCQLVDIRFFVTKTHVVCVCIVAVGLYWPHVIDVWCDL